MNRTGWPTTSRQSRGYGRDWEKKRAAILERDGYACQCMECKAQDRFLPATEVDHIVSKAKASSMGWTAARTEGDGNLQAINRDCHKRKTMEEQGKQAKAKQRIGLDGFPV